jgi:hypothetical protein
MSTAEESKAAHIAAMGDPLGSIYSALWQAVAHIQINWLEYVELFGKKPERINLLNRAAPTFFRMLQDELWEISLLHLARLTDHAKTHSRSDRVNLSIRALPPLIGDEKLKASVSALVDAAVRDTEFCRDWRNRRIAHRDLNLALDQPTMRLAEASRRRVDEALRSITDVLNALAVHYLDSETHFDLHSRVGGAVQLLYVMDDGLTAVEERTKRFQKGEYRPEDTVARDL